MEKFDDYFKKTGIPHKITTLYLLKKKVNQTIIDSIWAIFTKQKLFKSLWAKIAKVVIYLWN